MYVHDIFRCLHHEFPQDFWLVLSVDNKYI